MYFFNIRILKNIMTEHIYYDIEEIGYGIEEI